MIGFTNKAVAHISAAIDAAATQIHVQDLEYSAILSAYGSSVFLMLRGPVNRELVKVDIDASFWGNGFNDQLTVERGHGGTIAQSWPVGSMMFATTHEDHYNDILQRGINRVVSYNPNDVLSPLFKGEELYQDGPAGCERWWKSYNGVDPYWTLITGEPCGSEEYDDSWDYPILIAPPPVDYTWALKKDLSNETNVQYHLQSLAYDPTHQKLVAGTYGLAEIWTSGDGGETWTFQQSLYNPSPNVRAVYSLAFDSDNDYLFAGAGKTGTGSNKGEIWLSDDGGATWTLKKDLYGEVPSQEVVFAICHDSHNHTIVAGTGPNPQVWVSGDDGDNWTMKKEFTGEWDVESLVFDPDSNRIIAGTGGNGQIWVSENGGDTWTLKKELDNESPGQKIVMSFCVDTTENIIYAGTAYDGQIWSSDDGGDTWTLRKDLSNESPGQTAVWSMVYDPNRDRILAGTGLAGQVWVSEDSGDNWELDLNLSQEAPSQSIVHSLAYDSLNKIIVAGTENDAQIWKAS